MCQGWGANERPTHKSGFRFVSPTHWYLHCAYETVVNVLHSGPFGNGIHLTLIHTSTINFSYQQTSAILILVLVFCYFCLFVSLFLYSVLNGATKSDRVLKTVRKSAVAPHSNCILFSTEIYTVRELFVQMYFTV